MAGMMLTAGAGAAGGGMTVMVLYIIVIGAFFYFMMIRPQNKERKEKEAMLSALAIGDSVRTTAGFYGTVIDISGDMVIVEFGSNKNCRIPMDKSAIVQIEKPEDAVASDSGEKK